jgi:hypothetical protein
MCQKIEFASIIAKKFKTNKIGINAISRVIYTSINAKMRI